MTEGYKISHKKGLSKLLLCATLLLGLLAFPGARLQYQFPEQSTRIELVVTPGSNSHRTVSFQKRKVIRDYVLPFLGNQNRIFALDRHIKTRLLTNFRQLHCFNNTACYQQLIHHPRSATERVLNFIG